MQDRSAPRPSVTTRVAQLQSDVATRFVDAVWELLHLLGAHRWREGYVIDAERGMSQYRGSRCTVCDAPWEGW